MYAWSTCLECESESLSEDVWKWRLKVKVALTGDFGFKFSLFVQKFKTFLFKILVLFFNLKLNNKNRPNIIFIFFPASFLSSLSISKKFTLELIQDGNFYFSLYSEYKLEIKISSTKKQRKKTHKRWRERRCRVCDKTKQNYVKVRWKIFILFSIRKTESEEKLRLRVTKRRRKILI